jgi:hypothetical protein
MTEIGERAGHGNGKLLIGCAWTAGDNEFNGLVYMGNYYL